MGGSMGSIAGGGSGGGELQLDEWARTLRRVGEGIQELKRRHLARPYPFQYPRPASAPAPSASGSGSDKRGRGRGGGQRRGEEDRGASPLPSQVRQRDSVMVA